MPVTIHPSPFGLPGNPESVPFKRFSSWLAYRRHLPVNGAWRSGFTCTLVECRLERIEDRWIGEFVSRDPQTVAGRRLVDVAQAGLEQSARQPDDLLVFRIIDVLRRMVAEFLCEFLTAMAPRLNQTPVPWSNSFSVRTVSLISSRGSSAPGFPYIGTTVKVYSVSGC